MSKDYLVEGYGVTPCGIVFSKERKQEINNRWGGTTVRTIKGRNIKPYTDSKGRYQYVNLDWEWGRKGEITDAEMDEVEEHNEN